MPQCSTCGANVREKEPVCPECGMELGGAPAPAGPQQSTFAPPITPPAAPQSPARLPASPATASQAASGLAKLTLRRAGALTNESFPLGERVTIGRFDIETGPVDVDFGPVPEGAYLSRRHAEIWRDASGGWFIKDLGSQNGTFVRPASDSQFQRVVQDHQISDGDEIAFGNGRFEFRTT